MPVTVGVLVGGTVPVAVAVGGGVAVWVGKLVAVGGAVGLINVAVAVGVLGGMGVAVAVDVAILPMVTAPLTVLPGIGKVVVASLKLVFPLKTTGILAPVQAALAVTVKLTIELIVAGSATGEGEKAKIKTLSVSI